MSEFRLAHITCASQDEARAIGEQMVSERLAACANILGPMTSIYHWEGEIECAEEVVLILKTTAKNMMALTARVKAIHSYSVPCVLSIPVNGEEGNPDYLAWLRAEAAPQD